MRLSVVSAERVPMPVALFTDMAEAERWRGEAPGGGNGPSDVPPSA